MPGVAVFQTDIYSQVNLVISYQLPNRPRYWTQTEADCGALPQPAWFQEEDKEGLPRKEAMHTLVQPHGALGIVYLFLFCIVMSF